MTATITPAGIVADGQTDNSAVIQAALDDPDVTCVVLPEGEIGIASTITIPSGKMLIGAGTTLTTIVALDGFTTSGPFATALLFAAPGSDVTLEDFTVDGRKVGL